MQSLDRRAIEKYGIPGIVLMENAGLRSADFIAERYNSRHKILIVCGRGNNGGDGFVVARHLIGSGYSVSVVVLAKQSDISGDALTNLLILINMKARVFFKNSKADTFFMKKVKECNLIIDAIFGIGLKREVVEPIRSYIKKINASNKLVISLDVPSGLDADKGMVLGEAVKASYTLTMGFAKKGFFVYQGPAYAGKIYLIDIGLPGKR